MRGATHSGREAQVPQALSPNPSVRSDAVTGTSDEKRRRYAAYEKPLAARLYDVDTLVTSRALWGAPLATQVAFNRRALVAAHGDGRPYLDVPVGTGLALARARRGRPQPSAVVAVDISEAMLRRARRRLGRDALLVRGDVERLPFRDGVFGAVHSGNGFHLFPSTDLAAGEIARVVHDGGRCFFSTWVRSHRRVAELGMRVLRRLRAINEPAPRRSYERAFDRAGLETIGAETRGSLLLWAGEKRPAGSRAD